MAKLKLPDGISVKQDQYRKLLNVWQTIKEQLISTEELLEDYSVSQHSKDCLHLEIFGFSFFVTFNHNFKQGQVVYSRRADDMAPEKLLAVNFDAKGKLGEPYSAYSVKDYALVNLNILDSITSVSRLVK